MGVITTLPLRDGSINGKSRAEIIVLMADDLGRLDAWRLEADAIRALMATGKYSSFDIMRELDNARQLAMQDAVAKVMEAS